jgi:hypothetical protein
MAGSRFPGLPKFAAAGGKEKTGSVETGAGRFRQRARPASPRTRMEISRREMLRRENIDYGWEEEEIFDSGFWILDF